MSISSNYNYSYNQIQYYSTMNQNLSDDGPQGGRQAASTNFPYQDSQANDFDIVDQYLNLSSNRRPRHEESQIFNTSSQKSITSEGINQRNSNFSNTIEDFSVNRNGNKKRKCKKSTKYHKPVHEKYRKPRQKRMSSLTQKQKKWKSLLKTLKSNFHKCLFQKQQKRPNKPSQFSSLKRNMLQKINQSSQFPQKLKKILTDRIQRLTSHRDYLVLLLIFNKNKLQYPQINNLWKIIKQSMKDHLQAKKETPKQDLHTEWCSKMQKQIRLIDQLAKCQTYNDFKQFLRNYKVYERKIDEESLLKYLNKNINSYFRNHD